MLMTGLDALPQRVEFSPDTDLYPRYVADPRRSRHLISVVQAVDSEIPGAGDTRFLLMIGGVYPLARLQSGATWQVDVEARYIAEYDIDRDLDEIGHDARLGLHLSRSFGPRLVGRIGAVHTSSHMGDEYILREEITERLNSRKEEVAAGLSWAVRESTRAYVEGGYGLNLGPLNEPLRFQTGLEWEGQPFWSAWRPYVAGDLATWEEDRWDLSATIQGGIVFPRPEKTRWFRLGLEVYDGRSRLDSFQQFDERYVVVGMWMDL
jgi:hypothetical protein